MLCPSSKNEFLTIVVKTDANADVKVFWLGSVLLNLSTFCQMPCHQGLIMQGGVCQQFLSWYSCTLKCFSLTSVLKGFKYRINKLLIGQSLYACWTRSLGCKGPIKQDLIVPLSVLPSVLLSVLPSVSKFFQDWLISFF